MKTYLNVPFKEKDKAKRLGACWDIARKTWYIENVTNIEVFSKWMRPEHLAPFKPTPYQSEERIFPKITFNK